MVGKSTKLARRYRVPVELCVKDWYIRNGGTSLVITFGTSVKLSHFVKYLINPDLERLHHIKIVALLYLTGYILYKVHSLKNDLT